MIAGDGGPVGDGDRGGARTQTSSSTRRRSARTSASARGRRSTRPRSRRPASLARPSVELLALTHLSNRYFGGEVAREARTIFPDTVVPKDFDTIDVRFEERGGPELVKGGALTRRGETRGRAEPARRRRNDANGAGGDGRRRHRGRGAADDPALGRNRLASSRPRSTTIRAGPRTPRRRCSSPRTSLEAAQHAIEALTEPEDIVDESLISARVAGSYDELRPADDNWWEVFELLVREGDLAGGACSTSAAGRDAPPRRSRRAARASGASSREPEMAALARARVSTVKVAPGRAAAVQGRLVRARADVARRPPRRPAARVRRGGARARPDGRLAIATFDPEHFERYWLNRSSRRSRRSTGRGSRRPRSSGRARERPDSRAVELHAAQRSPRASTARTAVERVRGRFISPLQLLDEGELEDGLERMEAELPERNEYAPRVGRRGRLQVALEPVDDPLEAVDAAVGAAGLRASGGTRPGSAPSRPCGRGGAAS